MKLEGTGKLLRIFIGESDHWHGKPLYAAIVERLRQAQFRQIRSQLATRNPFDQR